MAIDLNTIWFLLVGALLAGYAVLDGFDLGVGILHLFVDRDGERRVFINAIGPVWDGNEVWLVTGGGALFAAFGEGDVGGGAPVRFEGPVPLWGRVGIRLWLMVQRVAGLASGCLLFATREAFEACGGFDPGLHVAEDVDLSRRLRRRGRFVIIGEPVVTSGRMVRSFGFWEMAGIALGALRHGFLFHRRRTGHWYVARREAPPTSSERT